MKRMRWKGGYVSGDEVVDARNRALVGMLEGFAQELGRKEHCQDMNELYADLVELAGRHLETDPVALGQDGGAGRVEVAEVIRSRFPLAALSTPACKSCGLCDQLEAPIRDWLGERPVPPRVKPAARPLEEPAEG
jgi:hypothetical protein